MGWDEVCILCGIRQYGGPTCLGAPSEDTPAQIAREVHDAGFVDLSTDEISSMLVKIFSEEQLDPAFVQAVHPGYDKDCIAIGYFDRSGAYTPCTHHGRPLHPTGDNVEVRRVVDISSGMHFTKIVELHRGERVERAGDTNCDTYWRGGTGTCNIWVHVACWAHLQHWLACALPPRAGTDGRPLALAGELYELTASRAERQVDARGDLPCVAYGGTLDAFAGTQYQDYALGPRKGTKHLVRALRQGLRGAELIPALLKDSRFWMFTRPDIWPRAPHPGPYDANPVSAAADPAPQPRAGICRLPNELLPELLQHVRLADVFALALTCRELHLRVLDRSVLVHTLHRAAADAASALRWVLPVPRLREEWLGACEAMGTWMPPPPPRAPTFAEMEFAEDEEDDGEFVPSAGDSDGEDTSDEAEDDNAMGDDEPTGPADDEAIDEETPEEAMTDEDEGVATGHISDVPIPLPPDPAALPLPALPLFDPAFPVLTYLQAFRDSDSMRARERRWDLIKQWDVLFTHYRRDGWERDEFAPPGTAWALDDRGELRCQCRPQEAS